MNKEFDFIDLYYLNDVNATPQTEDLEFLENPVLGKMPNFIRISDAENADTIAYTYDKFVEILDKQGLEGLVI